MSRCAVDKVTSSWRISPPQGLSSIQALEFFRCRRSGRGVQNPKRKTQRWADGSSVSVARTEVLAKLKELWGPTARLLAGILPEEKTQVERLDAERRLGPWGQVLLAGGVRFRLLRQQPCGRYWVQLPKCVAPGGERLFSGRRVCRVAPRWDPNDVELEAVTERERGGAFMRRWFSLRLLLRPLRAPSAARLFVSASTQQSRCLSEARCRRSDESALNFE